MGIFFLLSLISPRKVFATQFKLFAPSGTLERGQTYDFTIEVDTEGESLTQTQIGLTYDTKYLEFEGITPGDTFSVVSSQDLSEGKILITGSNDEEYSGSGTFAYAKFKIIANAPGETELCVLWAPSATPSEQSQPTNTPTSPPVKASGNIPKTGGVLPGLYSQIAGVLLILISVIFILIKKHQK